MNRLVPPLSGSVLRGFAPQRFRPSAALRLCRSCTTSPCSAEQQDAQQLVRARAEEAVLARVTRPLEHSSSPVCDVRSFGVARMARAMSEPTARLLLDEVLDQLAFAQEHVTGFEDGEDHRKAARIPADNRAPCLRMRGGGHEGL